MTPRTTKRQRLERAGWVYVAGWLRQERGEQVNAEIRTVAEEAERIGSSGQERRGRPLSAQAKATPRE